MSDILVPPSRDGTRLAGDEIAAVLEVLALDRLPPVLGHRIVADNDVDHSTAMRRGRESLRARGLLDVDSVDPELRDWMWALVRPVWQVSVRVVVGDAIVDRFCIGAGPSGAVVVGRSLTADEPGADAFGTGHTVVPPDLEIRRIVDSPGDVIVGIIGRVGGFPVGVPGHPAAMVADLLGKRRSPDRTAGLLERWELDERRARSLASALANEERYVEIVVERRRHQVPVQAAAPILASDTPKGRILVLTSTAADGAAWMSLVPGSARRLIEEIDGAVRAARQAPDAGTFDGIPPGLR